MVRKHVLKKPAAADVLEKPAAADVDPRPSEPPAPSAKKTSSAKATITFEATRGQYVARTGLKGSGQTKSVKVGAGGKQQAYKKAQVWLKAALE